MTILLPHQRCTEDVEMSAGVQWSGRGGGAHGIPSLTFPDPDTPSGTRPELFHYQLRPQFVVFSLCLLGLP